MVELEQKLQLWAETAFEQLRAQTARPQVVVS